MAKLRPGAVTIDLPSTGIYGDADHCPVNELLESAEAMLSLLPKVDHDGLWGIDKDFDPQCYLLTTSKRYKAPDVSLEWDHTSSGLHGAPEDWFRERKFNLKVLLYGRDVYWQHHDYHTLIGKIGEGGKAIADTEGVCDLTAEARADRQRRVLEYQLQGLKKGIQMSFEDAQRVTDD